MISREVDSRKRVRLLQNDALIYTNGYFDELMFRGSMT